MGLYRCDPFPSFYYLSMVALFKSEGPVMWSVAETISLGNVFTQTLNVFTAEIVLEPHLLELKWTTDAERIAIFVIKIFTIKIFTIFL